MEILRVPPYSLNAVIDVEFPSTVYNYTIEDMADHSLLIGVTISSSDLKVSIPLPSKYDNTYLITIAGEEHFFEVVRPYVDPRTKGTTASEVAEYAKNEELARAIIDSIISDGFYYRKKIYETTGLGADYLPIWTNAQKLLKLYENNALLYDSSEEDPLGRNYSLTSDKFAIVESYDGSLNRYEGAPNILPAAGSDSTDLNWTYRGFPRGFDYKAVLEVGYRNIPSDVVRATELLIEDISCGKLEYQKRYIADYNTDQFKIKFDSRSFEGTGNILVDKILSKYATPIRSIGVL
jgi:hypothetical protein